MLAYIFWHWPYPDVERRAYERSVVDFHRSLAADRPPGFIRSGVFRLGAAPWPGAQPGGYEDWYLVEGSWALDPLNEAAVAEGRKPLHDQAARAAAIGAGGLCRRQSGELDLPAARLALRFPKPTGMPYDALYRLLEAALDPAATSLWRRQLVLGPAAEFCLLSSGPVALPAPLSGASIGLAVLWP